MILSQLKLVSLSHCFVLLPNSFIEKEAKCKIGCIISLRSVQRDTEILVIWDGRLSTDDQETQLDVVFAEANGFVDESIVVSLAPDQETQNCAICRVEVLEASHVNIINEHLSNNLLDKCRLVYKDLRIPIWISDHVRVVVKIMSAQPLGTHLLLSQWTELQVQEPNIKSNNEDEDEDALQVEELVDVKNPISIISNSVGIRSSPRFHYGNLLIHGPRGSGKTYRLKQICYDYQKFQTKLISCKQLRGKRFETIKKLFRETFDELVEKQPFILCLDDIDAIVGRDERVGGHKDQEALYRGRILDLFCQLLRNLERTHSIKSTRGIVICTCPSLESIDERLSSCPGRTYFSFIIPLADPTPRERLELVDVMAKSQDIILNLNGADKDRLTSSTKSYMPSDLRQIVERAIINACSRSQLEFNSEPITLKMDDFEDAISNYTPTNLRNVTLKPRTSVTFSEIGGLHDIKEQLYKTFLLPLKYPKLFKSSPIRPQSSVLLYGPPGCGKTMLAEALTNHEQLNSICIRGPELLSKYIGSSEAAVRDVFRKAQMARPCVLFFDEFESLVAKRGSDSTGVTDRVVNQFLTLMDGFEELSNGIFILAASSRPDMIDPAILRPGRIDKHIYCGLPSSSERLDIIKRLSFKMKIDDSKSCIESLAEAMIGFTGADIQSLLYSAQIKALHVFKSRDFKEIKLESIVVSREQLWDSFNEMTEEIGRKYEFISRKYPRDFKIKSRLEVGVRATQK